MEVLSDLLAQFERYIGIVIGVIDEAISYTAANSFPIGLTDKGGVESVELLKIELYV